MKKLLVISIIVTYAVFSAGVNVIIHTCGDESEALLATTSFEDPCGCTDASAADRCCTTSLTTVKVDDAQLSAAVNHFEIPLWNVMILRHSAIATNISTEEIDIRSFVSFSPPSQYDLNIRYSVFLI